MLGFSDSIIISPLERRRLKHRLRNPSHTVFYAERKGNTDRRKQERFFSGGKKLPSLPWGKGSRELVGIHTAGAERRGLSALLEGY